MAEFCYECAKKYLGISGKVVLSRDLELCEGCGEYKQVVVKTNPGLMDRVLEGIRNGMDKRK